MATLVKRHNRWSVVYKTKDEQGNWKTVFRTTGCKDETEARQFLETFNAAREGRLKREALRTILQEAGYRVGPEILLSELWGYYQQHAEKTGSPDQQRARQNMVAGFVRWCTEKHPELVSVRDVDEQVAAEYWRWMAEDGKSPRTRNNIRGQLIVTWKGIQAEAGIAVNPWDLVQRDQGGGESYRVLELAEILSVFKAAKGYSEPGVEGGFWPWAIVAGLHTGLRLGDLATLEWEELQPQEGLLVLAPNKTKHWGSDRWAVHTLDAPWVGMLPPRPQPQPGGNDREAPDAKNDGPNYVWPHAAAKSSRRKGLRGFAEICAMAELKTEAEQAAGRRKRAVKLVTFHSLRHSFVTHLLRTGKVTEQDLVRQGNWSTVEVVANVYNSAKWEQAKLAAAKVAAAMPTVQWE